MTIHNLVLAEMRLRGFLFRSGYIDFLITV